MIIFYIDIYMICMYADILCIHIYLDQYLYNIHVYTVVIQEYPIWELHHPLQVRGPKPIQNLHFSNEEEPSWKLIRQAEKHKRIISHLASSGRYQRLKRDGGMGGAG